MASAPEDLIQKAIAAAKAGDRVSARKLLSQALKQAPNDARAWYLLSQVAENREQSIFCLNQVLRIEPDNAQAAGRLERLRSESQTPPRTADSAGEFKDTGFAPPAGRRAGRSGWLAGLLLGLLVCLAAVAGLWYGYTQGGWPFGNQLAANPLTATPAGEGTAFIQATAPPPSQTPLSLPAAPTRAFTPTPAGPPFGGQSECLPTQPITYTGMVTRVFDGDTIEITLAGRPIRLRYLGADAPSIDDVGQAEYPLAVAAAARNRELVQGQHVTVILAAPSGQADSSVPVRGLVFAPDLNGVLVTQELLQTGLARLDPVQLGPGCLAQFRQAEDAAHQAALGVWQPTRYPSATPENIGPVAPGGCACTGPDLSCENFATRFSAQACYDLCNRQGFGDIFKLDEDGDGQVCEN